MELIERIGATGMRVQIIYDCRSCTVLKGKTANVTRRRDQRDIRVNVLHDLKYTTVEKFNNSNLQLYVFVDDG